MMPPCLFSRTPIMYTYPPKYPPQQVPEFPSCLQFNGAGCAFALSLLCFVLTSSSAACESRCGVLDALAQAPSNPGPHLHVYFCCIGGGLCYHFQHSLFISTSYCIACSTQFSGGPPVLALCTSLASGGSPNSYTLSASWRRYDGENTTQAVKTTPHIN
jgi:hypothetical protein